LLADHQTTFSSGRRVFLKRICFLGKWYFNVNPLPAHKFPLEAGFDNVKATEH
jgi:hypothetical protein